MNALVQEKIEKSRKSKTGAVDLGHGDEELIGVARNIYFFKIEFLDERGERYSVFYFHS